MSENAANYRQQIEEPCSLFVDSKAPLCSIVTMRFTNPDTSEIVEVDFSIELQDMLAKAAPGDCPHQTTEIRARTIQGGSVQIKPQCLNCGAAIGNPLPKAKYPHVLPFDEQFLELKKDESERIKWEVAQNYLAMRVKGELDFQANYQAYLASPEWKRRRSHVLKRCGGVCEGCMEEVAIEIHHLSYRHFGAEFLFELAALCRACHSRIHHMQVGDDPDSRPCRGCRFQAGDETNCSLYNVSEFEALSDSRYCGPELAGLQGLK